MNYVPIGWPSGTSASAKNFNRMETMFACAKSHIDIHDHDDSYYTKILADTYFFDHSGTNKPDADTIDGKHYDELIGGLLPKKTVLGWNGTDANVPDGWHIADGGTYNGITTPDMRGKLPLGAGRNYTTQSTGGNAVLSNAGGTATIGDHLLVTGELPNHYHNWSDNYDTGGGSSDWTIGSWLPTSIQTTTTRSATTDYNHSAADEAHNHGTKSITLNNFSIMPLYVAKYYIIKVV